METKVALKSLGLNYEKLDGNTSFQISPMEFDCDFKIILIDQPIGYEMFIWHLPTETIKMEVKFNFTGGISNNYSFLIAFYKNNLRQLNNDERKSIENEAISSSKLIRD